MKTLTLCEARWKNPIVLAFVGDTVYDLFVRTSIVADSAAGIQAVHKKAVHLVNAHAQARAAEALEPLFTEAETEVYRRGRNAKSAVPKNMTVADYRKATGLEAVIGYLWLVGETDRLEALFEVILRA